MKDRRLKGRLLRRLVAFGFLGLWLAPGAGALAVGLHVALEHHGHHDSHHDPATLGGLALAVAHGHHHHDVAPHHDHPVALDVPAGLAWNPHFATALPDEPGLAPTSRPDDGATASHRHRRPVALFRIHCALLL